MARHERELDSGAGVVQEFALELRGLRGQAGGLTYRQLALRSGYSVSTLCLAASGRRLPTLDVAVGFAVACGGDQAEWSAKWHAAAFASTAPGNGESANGAGRPPYQGLASFRAEDADLFFGREQLVTEVVRQVVKHPVTVVLGPSGAGKSSLLAAGVVPALCASSGAEPAIRSLVLTPGDDLWASLLRRMPGASDPAPASAAEAATARVNDLLADGPLLLVIDQFEEVYTLCEAAERNRFVDGVLTLADRPDQRLRIVLSVRADFYGHCAEHAGLAKLLRENQVLVGPMCTDELRETVSRPARAVGLSVERALLAKIAVEGAGHAGVLPLLSHAMLETWRRRRGDVLTLAAYDAVGGINGALARTAEATYAALEPAQRRLAAELLLRLLVVVDSAQATRRRVDLTELADVDPDAWTVINQLATARLVTVDEDTVEIAHEALLTAWPRLRALVEDGHTAVRMHRKVTEATRFWVDNGRDPATLVTGAQLTLMRSQLDNGSTTLRLSTVEREFLDASTDQLRQAEATARRRTRRLRAVAVLAAVGTVLSGVLAGVAGSARQDALDARDIAVSRQVALTAQKLRETDPALAAQLAVAGYRIGQTTEARSSLLESSALLVPARYLGGAGPTAMTASAAGDVIAVSNATNGSVQLLSRSGDRLTRAGVIMLNDQDAMVYALALSPDSDILAVGDTTAAITLWDVSNRRAPTKLAVAVHRPAGAIERLVFRPDGREFAAAGADGVVRWALDEPTAPRLLAQLPTNTLARTVSYDGRGDLLAVGTDDGAVHLWDTGALPTQLAVLRSGDQAVPGVSFAPNGPTLVTGSHDRRIRTWDISTPTAPKPGRIIDGLFDLRITTTAFSPAGDYLIAGSSDSTIRILDTATWTTQQVLPHPDVVTWAEFTDTGQSVVSVAADGAMRKWSLAQALPRRVSTPVDDTPFSADGARLGIFTESDATVWATSAADDLVRLTPALPTSGGRAMFTGAGDISGDGQLLAAATQSGEVRLFDVAAPERPQLIAQLPGGGEEVVAVAFSPDGTMVAAGGRDTTIRVWDITEPRQPRQRAVLDAPRDVVLDLDWSPSGEYLAAASADSHVYLFNLGGNGSVPPHVRLDGLNSYVFSATFSPDGRILAAGGVDKTVLVWDVSTPAKPRRIGQPITGPAGRILELSFHPGGNLLAASVLDGTMWLWDIADPWHPTRHAVLDAADSPLNTAAFRPTGDRLVAGSADLVIHTWNTDENATIRDICAHVGDVLTEAEWHTYIPGVPYDTPCPLPPSDKK